VANTNTEDLANHNLSKPIIRTMENDLRSLKSDAPPKDILKNLPKIPANLPVDFSEPLSAPSPSAPKSFKALVSPNASVPTPVSHGAASGGRSNQDERPGGRIKQANGSFVRPIPESEPERRKTSDIEPQKQTDKFSVSGIAAPVSPSKNETRPVAKKEFIKPFFNKVPGKISDIKEEKPASKPQAYARFGETEILPPEARLAVQSSVTDFGAEKKSADNSLPQNISASPAGFYKFSGHEKNGKGLDFGKILKYVLAIAVIAAVSYGIYYFVALNKQGVNPPETAGELLIQGAWPVELKKNSGEEAVGEIKKYFYGLGASRSPGVYRIILRDESGDKILTKDDFEKTLGIELPSAIANALSKDYNLLAFFYPQKNYLRLGLIFKVNDSNALSRELSLWEPSMFKDAESLFLGSPVLSDPAAGFGSNNYKEASVRYLPLGYADTALNYAMDKNKKFLLVATSKDDIFYLIENISQ
jgi:hypothetical protein